MEAFMILDCSNYSKNLVDILKLFQQIGWDIYNPQGKVEYLPIGDNDMYDWQCEEMSETKLYDIIAEKIAKKEQAGVDLYYNNGIEGVSFLAHTTDQIIYKLWDVGVRLLSYTVKEYED